MRLFPTPTTSPDGVHFFAPVPFGSNNSIDGLSLQGVPACGVTMFVAPGHELARNRVPKLDPRARRRN